MDYIVTYTVTMRNAANLESSDTDVLSLCCFVAITIVCNWNYLVCVHVRLDLCSLAINFGCTECCF